MTKCPSDLAFDRLDAGELSPAAEQTLRDHAAACGGCEDRLASLAARRDAFLGDPILIAAGHRAADELAASAAPIVEERPWWRPVLSLAIPALGVAAAAVLVVFVSPGPDDGLRLKGDLSVSLHARTPTGTRPIGDGDGDAILPGTEITLQAISARPGFAAVYVLDGAGLVQRLLPLGQATAPTLAQGASTLPTAARVDDTPGKTTFWLVRCNRAQSAATLSAMGLRLPKLPAGCSASSASVHVK